jgi:hypothetical protein
MTLAELHKKKPIADDMLIEIHIPYTNFAEYVKNNDYKREEYYRIIQKDDEYIRELACTIYTKCKVSVKAQHSVILLGYFKEVKQYFDLETLEILEMLSDRIVTEYKPK